MKRVGLIINPFAGIGGRVGLKGSDGVVEQALAMGALPQAANRAEVAMANLLEMKDAVLWVTCAGHMGANLLNKMGFSIESEWMPSSKTITSAEDTQDAARWMLEQKVDLLIFVGGDGTARDLYQAVGDKVTALGIPAGVKIHSPVYAKSPAKAGEMAHLYLSGKIHSTFETEVLDLDEEAYRAGKVKTTLFGYLVVPSHQSLMQCRKAPTPLSEAQAQRSMAAGLVQAMEPDRSYILGPGTTTRAVMETLGLEGTLLGVDVIKNKQLVHRDVSEKQLLDVLDLGRAALVLTPTGGQGYLLGRGNQQISPAVLTQIGRENLHVLCTKEKLAQLKGQPLMVDTGDSGVDALFKGYIKVTVGYNEFMMYKLDY